MKDAITNAYRSSSYTVECLRGGYVQLLDCMPRVIEEGEDGLDYAIAEAARCSYQRGTKSINDDKALLRYLMRHNHTSPFEMIEFKFKMKLPIFIARQLIRHRTASVNEMSGRYSEMPEEYYVPTLNDFRGQDKVNHQGSDVPIREAIAFGMWGKMSDNAKDSFALYNNLLDDGLSRETARIILPLATYTEWYWKIDLKNLLHFLDLRCDSHSQREMQEYGNAVLSLIKPLLPITIEAWEDYSPYRGGILLTKQEVEILRGKIVSVDSSLIKNKVEKAEWEEKAKRLGINTID